MKRLLSTILALFLFQGGIVYRFGGQNTMVMSTTYSNATTGFTDVPGLAMAVEAGQNYTITCILIFSGSATTAEPKWQATGPSSPTGIIIGLGNGGLGITSATSAVVTGFSTPIAPAVALGATGTNYISQIYMQLKNGPNAGTVQLQAAANGAGTLTVQTSSSCNAVRI